MSCHACPPFTSSVCFGKVAIISGQTVLAELPVNAAFWLFVFRHHRNPMLFAEKYREGMNKRHNYRNQAISQACAVCSPRYCNYYPRDLLIGSDEGKAARLLLDLHRNE